MLNVLDAIKSLYKKDSVDKYFFATFRDLGIAKCNSDIISESLSITESVCSGSNFKLGLCEANTLKISMHLDKNVAGDEVTIFEVIGKFEPSVSTDDIKGIIFEGDNIRVLYEGSLSDIGSTSTVFNGEKNYLLIGKVRCDSNSTFIYTLLNNDKNAIYYFPLDVDSSTYINICIPIIGSDFDLYPLKFYSNNTIDGYFTLYEVDNPIMPLGLYHIDSSKKSHNNADVRDIIGYDRLVISGLDEQVQYAFDSDVNINDFMSDVLQNSPINIGLDVEAGQIDGYVEPYEVNAKDVESLSIDNPVYRFHAEEQIIHVNGTYTELNNFYAVKPQISPNPDPNFDGYGIIASNSGNIKPKNIVTKAAEWAYFPDYDVYNWTYPNVSEFEKLYDSGNILKSGHISESDWYVISPDVNKYVPNTPYPAVLRTITHNIEPFSRIVAIYSWDNDDISTLSNIIHNLKDSENNFTLNIYGIDLDVNSDFAGTIDTNKLKNKTYLQYNYFQEFVYTWNIDVPKTAYFQNFVYKKQSDYDEGKITYEELIKGGVEADIVIPDTIFSWTLQLIKTSMKCSLTNYDKNKTYLVYNESLYTNAAYILSESAYNDASSMTGEFLINQHDIITSLIVDNTTTYVEFDTDGNFTLNYISKANLICTNGRSGDEIQNETVISDYPIRYIVRKRGQGNLIFYTLPISENPLNISVFRRFIVESYLELNGDFLHMNRYGVSSLLQIQPSHINTYINYKADEFQYARDVIKEFINILPDITFESNLSVPQSEFELVNTSTSYLPIDDIEYTQYKEYKPDRDLELISSDSVELALDGPVYSTDSVNIIESIVAIHNTYSMIADTSGEYSYNIETDIGSIIDFESSIKDIALQTGELLIDRQSEILSLINDYDESVHIYKSDTEGDTLIIDVQYIKSISYAFNPNIIEGSYTANNIVFSIYGPNVFNNGAIFVNSDERCYASVTLHDNEYSLELNELQSDYSFNVEHDISSLHTLVSDAKSSVSSRGELIIDRQSYLDNLIDNYNESVTISQSDNIITVFANYIDSMDVVSYKGYTDDPVNQKYSNSQAVSNVFSLSYIGEISSNPVYGNTYYRYYIDVEYSDELYILPNNQGITLYYNELSDVKSDILGYIDEVRTQVLSDIGNLTIDRHNDFISALSNWIDNNYFVEVSNDGLNLNIHKISKIICRKFNTYNSEYTVFMENSNFTDWLNYVNIFTSIFNAENITTDLLRSLYVDDELYGNYGGICITKSKPSTSEQQIYPFYYNADVTVGRNDNIRYYKVEGNFFIENFVFDITQLTMLCRDIFESLVNVDPYNIECDYKALPYTEVCDKVCIEGVDWNTGENSKYYTSIFRRTIHGNIGMKDTIETEFEK